MNTESVYDIAEIKRRVEPVGRLDAGFRNVHVDIPWFKIRGLLNKIAHGYEGVRLEIIGT